MISGASYDRIDDIGLHITVGNEPTILEVDNIIVCAGQDSQQELYSELKSAGVVAHLIGGAKLAGELDAKRAIRDGCELAANM